MTKVELSKFFKRFIVSLICLFSFGIIILGSKVKAADYSNADAGHFTLYADGSISAEFTVSDNSLDMNGWLLCLFTSQPIYDSQSHKLSGSNNLHPYSVSECAHYFFAASTAKTGKMSITWQASSNDQKTNWSATGSTSSQKKLSDYSLSETDFYIVIGPRHYNDSWGESGIGEGNDGYWENCDLYVGKSSEVVRDFVKMTMDLIDGIGEVSYTQACKNKLKEARESYEALSATQKASVTNYNTLVAKEEEYANLIKLNGEVKVPYIVDGVTNYNYYETLSEAIEASDAGSTIILNKDLDYSEIEGEINKSFNIDLNGHIFDVGEELYFIATNGAIISIDDSSNNVGGVKGVLGIRNDSNAYYVFKNVRTTLTLTQLSDDEVYRFANGYVVEEINNGKPDSSGFITIIRSASKDDVISYINDIGDVDYTDSCKELIDKARVAYDNLSDDDKLLVTNYKTLTDAEALYESLKEDNEKADEVIDLIDDIGEVELTDSCKDKIDAARAKYDLLTDSQKSLVTNYDDLTTAEGDYQYLVDSDAASKTIQLIGLITSVDYTEECKNKIDAARKSYDLLTDTQKGYVFNYGQLETSELVYNSVDNVVNLINDIGEVKYNKSTKNKIDAAKDAYDDLLEDAKSLVPNYETLQEAQTKYNELEKKNNKTSGWLIFLYIMLVIILTLAIVYILLFFVFNKYVKDNDKIIRVFKIKTKDNNVKLMKMNFIIINKNIDEIYKSKKDIK